MPAKGFQLVGAANFKRNNPMTDHFEVDRFHHIEFWCADATSTWKRRVVPSPTSGSLQVMPTLTKHLPHGRHPCK